MQIEGPGGLEVPYLGYVETHLKIPEIKAFDQDVLLLIIPNSAHTQCTPITLGTLHVDMAIRLATEKELKNLNKQWQWQSNMNWRELVGAVVPSTPGSSGSTLALTPGQSL